MNQCREMLSMSSSEKIAHLFSPLKPFNLSSIEIEENPQQVCQILKLIELLIINVIRQSPAKF